MSWYTSTGRPDLVQERLGVWPRPGVVSERLHEQVTRRSHAGISECAVSPNITSQNVFIN